MRQPRRSREARGYGNDHRRARERALKLLRDGDMCVFYGELPECPGPMYHGQRLDLDHNEDRTSYRGLAHMSCNRSAGASRGNRLREQPTEWVSHWW